ncbi:MAG TPA: radical SAM family heme chaperone HemW [Verrucomicrobiae bacterium]|nr:radical SAM family heme chaperone HemW [Verrucomicrobiae bacterium]
MSHRVRSLYVHVPFCAQKCSYCAFYSEASQGELIQRYTNTLVRELELVAGQLKPETVFFGGGTPSILNLKQWQTILYAMKRLELLGAAEWTIECNPATVSLDKCKLWRDYGVNRVSMGVQSLDDALLDRLGRIHTRNQVFKSFDVLRRGGFGNINVDLMFAIPGQTLEVWRATLAEALAFGSEHLSSYEVIYEDDTPLFAQLQAGEFSIDEDLACEMYNALLETAMAAGLIQYEVANFAKGTRPDSELPAYACRHNVNYWRGGEYFGLGPSAAGYVNGVRTKNWSNTTLYCEQLEKGQRAIESTEKLPPLRRAGEAAAFGLRMTTGWPWQLFQSTTGYDLRTDWADEINSLLHRGWATQNDVRFQLTPAGLRFADAAAELFLR